MAVRQAAHLAWGRPETERERVVSDALVVDWRYRNTVLADLYDGDYHLLTQREGNLADCAYYQGAGPCSYSCHSGPACQENEPVHGWRPLREEVMIPHPLKGVRYADGVA